LSVCALGRSLFGERASFGGPVFVRSGVRCVTPRCIHACRAELVFKIFILTPPSSSRPCSSAHAPPTSDPTEYDGIDYSFDAVGDGDDISPLDPSAAELNDVAFEAHLWRLLGERPEDHGVVPGRCLDPEYDLIPEYSIDDFIEEHFGSEGRPPARVQAVYDAIAERDDRARRARARCPQARREDAERARRYLQWRRRTARLEGERRQLSRDLELEAERIMEGDEEALQHWLDHTYPDIASTSDDSEYNQLLCEVSAQFLGASDAERLPHYHAAGARPPSTTRLPPVLGYYGEFHRALCTAIRARRRMPRRGQHPDQHIGRDHRLGPQLWGLMEHYRSWLAGSLDAASLPSLNELLGLVLGPPGSGSLSFIDDEGGSDCHTTIDVCGDPQTQYATLHRLGWPSYPTASELVGHILDRLEYDWALRLLESSLAGELRPHLGTPSAGPDPYDDVDDRDGIARDDYGRVDLRSSY